MSATTTSEPAPPIKWPLRKIGNTEVPALGYGAMSIGGYCYGQADEDQERFKLLDRLVELGETYWDTARIYGDSEDLIGKWFALDPTGQRRAKIFLSTKFGIGGPPDYRVSGQPDFIREQLATSLEKLHTDHVDLYYSHRPDPKTPIEITMGCLAELVKEGKIKYIGLSDVTPDTIRRAYKVHPVSALQIEYSPFERMHEGPGGVIETARELGITIVAYSPTGRGLATGRYKSPDDFAPDDLRRGIPRYDAEHFPDILAFVATLNAIGQAHGGASAAQIALAWMLATTTDVIPIPGSKTIKYAEENIRSVQIELGKGEIETISTAVEKADQTVGRALGLGPFAKAMGFNDTPPLESA